MINHQSSCSHNLIRIGGTQIFHCSKCELTIEDKYQCVKCGHDKSEHYMDEYECQHKIRRQCRCKEYQPIMIRFQKEFEYA